MRFMMIMFPKEYLDAKPGWVPDLKSMEAMGKYNEELGKAGVLLALDGLTPPATMSARVTFKNGKSTVTDGPFTETREVVGGYAIMDFATKEEAVESTRQFMELHRKFWPGWEGETEIRQMFGPEDYTCEGGSFQLKSDAIAKK